MPLPLPTPSQRIQSILNHLEIFRSLGVPYHPRPPRPWSTGRQMALPLESKEMEQWLLVTAQEKLGLKKHLRTSYEPLLSEPCILDIDATVKPLYGHQEGAVKGYKSDV